MYRTYNTFPVVLFWIMVMCSGLLFWLVIRRPNSTDTRTPEIEYSTFISQAEAGQIARVSITGTRIDGEYRSGNSKFWLTGPSNPAVFLGILQDKGVEIRFRDARSESGPLLRMLAFLMPLAALWGFLLIRIVRRRTPPSAPGGNLDGTNQQPLTPQ
jgi:ATP-dependent Zn protease